nr:MAG TPA: hypothetical protein [Caudoviricetes sp.]
MVKYQQKVTPNLNQAAYSGGCLNYVDNCVNPPNRQPTAQCSYELAKSQGHIHLGTPPQGVWVPIYFTIDNGRWAGYGHIAWYYRYASGREEIHDSEFHCGNRSAPYSSIQDLLLYMGWQMSYLGWSESVDGLRIVSKVEEVKPQPKTNKKGEYMFIVVTEKNKYVITADGYYTWIAEEAIYKALKTALPVVNMKDGRMRDMFVNIKTKKSKEVK